MKLYRICKTCEFGVFINGTHEWTCGCDRERTFEGIKCDEWGASLDYYSEITQNAPWYIKEPYDRQ